MLSIAFFILSCFCNYFPTQWDPIAMQTESTGIIRSSLNWFKKHKNNVYVDTFGDFSVFTLNFYQKQPQLTAEELTKVVENIIDKTHTTFLVLQGVQESLIVKLRALLQKSDHYAIINDEQGYADPLTSKQYYLPIIFDKQAVRIMGDPHHFTTTTEPEVMYASTHLFRTFDNKFLRLYNLDLFSDQSNVNSAFLANILADFASDKTINQHTVIFAGTMNALEQADMAKLNIAYTNLVEADPLNEKLTKTTLSADGKINDNIQRDFILLRHGDRQKPEKVKLNSARIQSLWKYKTDHLPVYAIISYIKEKVPATKSSINAKKEKDPAKALDEKAEQDLLNQALATAAQLSPLSGNGKDKNNKIVLQPIQASIPKNNTTPQSQVKKGPK